MFHINTVNINIQSAYIYSQLNAIIYILNKFKGEINFAFHCISIFKHQFNYTYIYNNIIL